MWIAVLGMHRSGTSAIAGILQTLGCQFGETKHALDPTHANAKGYWERQDVMHLNDALLALQGCAWDHVSRYRTNGWDDVLEPALERTMRNILLELDQNPPGFIKDPRLCLTLPVWARIRPPSLLIWVRREPAAVAGSLLARKDCSLAAGLALWEVYEHAIQTWAQNLPTIQVHFEAFQADPWAETQALAMALQKAGIPPPVPPDRTAISAWFDPGLIRQLSRSETAFMCPPDEVLHYQALPVREPTGLAQPSALSAFAREQLAYHETTVRPLEKKLAHTEALHRTASARINQLEDRLARLEKAEAAFIQSRLWRFMRLLHRWGCLLTGRPGTLQPMDKIHAVLHEESRPSS